MKIVDGRGKKISNFFPCLKRMRTKLLSDISHQVNFCSLFLPLPSRNSRTTSLFLCGYQMHCFVSFSVFSATYSPPKKIYIYKRAKLVIRSLSVFYRDCFPLVSIGSKHIATKAARNRAPDAYTGPDGSAWPALMATRGAHRPSKRLRKELMPVPVPRLGAGNTSGV